MNITLWVDTWDLLRPGVVLAVGCTALSVIASIWIGLIVLDSRSSKAASSRPLSTRLLTAEWASLAFMTVWILACAIPVTKTAVNGRVHTRAFTSTGLELSQVAVAATERRFGINSAYWSRYSVRLQVIPPWFAFLFALIATVVSFLASKKPIAHSTPSTTHTDDMTARNPLKPATMHNEKDPVHSPVSPINEKISDEHKETV
ncbi:hypothetical protein FRC16_002359 [Serendipita sp. 398]|nr:hypothetical protein FRC16_002359 [Serendipita sp. 398]